MSKRIYSDLHGVLNVCKEKGYTSHDVVAIIRKLTHAKVGHTGTLDPQAEGVLPVLLGSSTRLSDYIMSGTKEYDCEIIIGLSTDTEDITGTIIEKSDVKCTDEEVESAVKFFLGESEQLPPMYSAIKVNGKKLYELAREGKEVERKLRKITIYEINIIEKIAYNIFKIKVVCSSGTYMRTLCKDIGKKLGLPACMGELTRVRSGGFSLENAHTLGEIKENPLVFIEPADKYLDKFGKICVKSESIKRIKNGNGFTEDCIVSKVESDFGYLVYDSESELVGIYEMSNEVYKPVVVINNIDN